MQQEIHFLLERATLNYLRYIVCFLDYLATEHPDIYSLAKPRFEQSMEMYAKMKSEGKV